MSLVAGGCGAPEPGQTSKRQDLVGGTVAGRGQVERLEPLPAGLGERGAKALVTREAGDGAGQGVRIGGVHQEAGVADHFGQRAGPIGHDGQAHAHRLEHGHAESLVPRAHHEDVAPVMAPTRSESLSMPVKVTASCRPISSTKRRSAVAIGGHDRPPHHLEARLRVVVLAGDEERHHGELDALVRGDTTDADPAAAAVGRPPVREWEASRHAHWRGQQRGGRDHGGRARTQRPSTRPR